MLDPVRAAVDVFLIIWSELPIQVTGFFVLVFALFFLAGIIHLFF